MRFYCKNCETEFRFKDSTVWEDDNCPRCGNDDPGYELIPIPDYEPPEQYEKRTGKVLPYDAAVWWKYAGTEKKWRIIHLYSAKKYKTDGELWIVCAQSPEPPPNDWRPE